jgi:hypothetical protein
VFSTYQLTKPRHKKQKQKYLNIILPSNGPGEEDLHREIFFRQIVAARMRNRIKVWLTSLAKMVQLLQPAVVMLLLQVVVVMLQAAVMLLQAGVVPRVLQVLVVVLCL